MEEYGEIYGNIDGNEGTGNMAKFEKILGNVRKHEYIWEIWGYIGKCREIWRYIGYIGYIKITGRNVKKCAEIWMDVD